MASFRSGEFSADASPERKLSQSDIEHLLQCVSAFGSLAMSAGGRITRSYSPTPTGTMGVSPLEAMHMRKRRLGKRFADSGSVDESNNRRAATDPEAVSVSDKGSSSVNQCWKMRGIMVREP